ncbi:2-dehydro-3-deoxyphosphogluconate aldolase / (4S)-4-hydroxy-2-oxoglutarate aldolase [Saccharopolyspora antimicrobica]|uniref:2-dehydro-3-deoxyphosphogluconate aldolase / (4S)-4-hydroxy-2-oxoglutarate aldolase n=1 Tax=Saccharopolyspora antimicrobica TaxID=455193 RepID=A0A1I5CIL5_9PSEU|nr:bifunctional 4-hydroxy-2-oxoglutarate aldolase/2-dehydro-3-deoxy-phosphogluconate aldolase [Saccharopolyspora antimicrobica]RKT88844.1 2-keto-3-deoxy-phosphogluconate aldolase [Saccharopolyspora antimicrobica]SFN86737.1 2-dehydro-3-deoxyphosphogluconate aldolase / (4S)-4-hydroxy-2-oxoglutarate aldolase [Saccharopolyspora antimicrobica]
MTAAEFFQRYSRIPVMAILRGYPPERTVELCLRAWEVGIELVEVPVMTAEHLPALRAAIAAGREAGRPVGAGTVITPEQVDDVASAGAAFTVSPGYDPEIAEAAARRGLAHLPGVATASEITSAVRNGHRWLKAFPAAQLGPAWITAQHGPFPDVAFVATGGINAANAGDFLAAGARVVAVGSALEDPAQLDALAVLASS